MPIQRKKVKELVPNPCVGLRECLIEAQKQTGRSFLSMVAEIAWLRLFHLRAYDYFWFQLYLPLPGRRKRDFIGATTGRLLERTLNRRTDWGLVDDKLICQSLLQSVDIPCPRNHAAFHPKGRISNLCPVYSDLRSLRDFLVEAPYPLFCKPVSDGGGTGCFRAERFDGENLELYGGEDVLSFSELAEILQKPGRFGAPGYLFSEVIQPHDQLTDLSAVPCTIRILVLQADEPRILGSWMRIARPGRVTDNLGEDHSNLLTSVDVSTGMISVAVAGICPRQRRFTHHPDNGAMIEGRVLPFWEQCLEIVRKGAPLFPNLKIQGWDLAITQSGPTVVEVNVRSCKQSMQGPYHQPLLTPRVRKWIALAQQEANTNA